MGKPASGYTLGSQSSFVIIRPEELQEEAQISLVLQPTVRIHQCDPVTRDLVFLNQAPKKPLCSFFQPLTEF